LPSLNGVKNTYYCGSHFGFGLHEDAVTSAIEVARKLDVPFDLNV
jgi:predicted NAD/FAD-binding protein